MANKAGVDSDNVTPTPAAISAALHSNLALQSELKSCLLDVRKLQSQNRLDATEVLSSLLRIWDNDADTSTPLTTMEKDTEIPLELLTKKINDGTHHECSSSDNKNKDTQCNNREWTEEEVKQLQNSINAARNDASKQTPDNELLVEVASKCKIPSRSARDCHVALFTFADPAILTTKFTKIESRFILDVMSEIGDEDVDWLELATKFNEKLYPNRQHRRTPWQCFKHYQSTLKKAALPWSSDEDELFIKYLAAQGSQFLLQGDGLAQTNSKLFPYRNPNKLSIRSYTTLLNPNYVQDWWKKDEERKLALLMRAYSESDDTLPLKYASQAAHFPRRAQALVSVKWSRTLCPETQQKKCGNKLNNDETDEGGVC